MAPRVLMDTNLIVRHLVGDHAEHAEAAGRIFSACERREITLVLLPEVLSECVFVLQSFYKYTRADIARILGSLITYPGLDVPDCAVHADALVRFSKSKLHFIDCTLAAFAAAENCPIATFDQEFKKIGDVTVFPVPRS